MDWKQILEQNAARDPRFGRMVQGFRGPSWPIRTGILCGVAVVVVPLILTVLAGLLVGGGVYAVATLAVKIGEVFGLAGPGDTHDAGGAAQPRMPGDEYRDNVRVVPRG